MVAAEPASEGRTGEDSAEREVEERVGPRSSRALEVCISLGAFLAFAAILPLALTIPLRTEASPGQIDARFWPTVLAVVGLAVSLGRLVVSLLAAPENREELDRRQPGGLRRMVSTLLVTMVFIAVWSVGDVILAGYRIQLFPIAMALYLAALLALHGGRGWKPFVLFPIPLALGTYLLFGALLRIPL